MKLTLKVILILMALFVITGCSNSPTPNNTQTPPVTSDQQPMSDQLSDQANVKTDSGRYNGQIDANSIEIKISGVPDEIDPEVFRLSKTIKAEFNTYKLNTGDTLKFDYLVNEHGQKVITKLEVLNRSSQNPKPSANPVPNNTQTKIDTGRYVGQIDSNSIEIRISGVPDEISAKAFRLNDSIKANFQSYALQEGDQIKFSFIPQNEGQPVIISIEKL